MKFAMISIIIRSLFRALNDYCSWLNKKFRTSIVAKNVTSHLAVFYPHT
jgi:hypothetical protein